MSTNHERTEAARATHTAAEALYRQNPTAYAYKRRKAAENALEAAQAAENAAQYPEGTPPAPDDDASPAARELDAAADAYSKAQERAAHPGRGKTRTIAAAELDAYETRLQEALDTAAHDDPQAYADYTAAGARIARGAHDNDRQ